ncbi:hypothetical protein [Rhizobium sp. L43]|nr:hypothetical protein [Rhizobium sp. L43]
MNRREEWKENHFASLESIVAKGKHSGHIPSFATGVITFVQDAYRLPR